MIRDNSRKEMILDIVAWDVPNWWRAIEFWESEIGDVAGKRVLDLGGRKGGLSLYWALKGAQVICSDISSDGFDQARELHKKYGVENRVSYEIIDASEIPYKDEFDIICFKSVLGGVGRLDNYKNQEKMMKSIHNALRSNGKLMFCENLVGSLLHSSLRKHFSPSYGTWRYISISELRELTRMFSDMKYSTYGYLGVLGRQNITNQMLSFIDKKMDHFIKDENKYIVSCICNK